MGRPKTVPGKLKDGFYIELRNKGSKSGIKIWRANKAQMEMAIADFKKIKDVVVLGESKNGKWVDHPEIHQ